MKTSISQLAVLLAVGLAAGVAPAQQSASYRMERVTTATVADTASSPSYLTRVVFGQDSPSGASSFCNAGFVNSLGYWSVLGDLEVPVELHAAKAPDQTTVELIWSGASDEFELYRATSPIGLVSVTNLDLITTSCGSNDPDNGDTLVFYEVIPAPNPPLE